MQSEECEDEDGGGALSALEPMMKRIRLCADTQSTASTPDHDAEPELIPKHIESLQYPDDALIATLCRNDRFLIVLRFRPQSVECTPSDLQCAASNVFKWTEWCIA